MSKKHKKVSKLALLKLDVDTYNMLMETQYAIDKVKKNLSGTLHRCEHCGRKHVICCICPKAEARWDAMLDEVRNVSERDRSGEF